MASPFIYSEFSHAIDINIGFFSLACLVIAFRCYCAPKFHENETQTIQILHTKMSYLFNWYEIDRSEFEVFFSGQPFKPNIPTLNTILSTCQKKHKKKIPTKFLFGLVTNHFFSSPFMSSHLEVHKQKNRMLLLLIFSLRVNDKKNGKEQKNTRKKGKTWWDTWNASV